MTAMATDATRLGALEAQVMDVLWDQGPATVREVIARLPHDPAYTTIATVLTNLARKGLAESTRQGHATVHQARVTREQHVATMMNQALAASRDRAASILHFAESIPETDLDLLREFLNGREPGST